MGGTVALELAARCPSLTSAIVLIDSVIFPSPGLVDALWPFARALDSERYRKALCETVSSLFLPSDNGERKSRLISAMCRVPQHVLASSFRNHITDCDAGAAVERCRARVAYIAATQKLADLDEFVRRCPQLMVAQTLGAGHFSPLEVPDQVNAMIERCWAIAAETSSTQASRAA